MLSRLLARLRHPVYLSTACQHGLHRLCRRTCKWCTARCVCPCHLIPVMEDQ